MNVVFQERHAVSQKRRIGSEVEQYRACIAALEAAGVASEFIREIQCDIAATKRRELIGLLGRHHVGSRCAEVAAPA